MTAFAWHLPARFMVWLAAPRAHREDLHRNWLPAPDGPFSLYLRAY